MRLEKEILETLEKWQKIKDKNILRGSNQARVDGFIKGLKYVLELPNELKTN